ncbi:MAG: ferritin family protein [bacterium]|nr:ferritin family protein [bacterium]
MELSGASDILDMAIRKEEEAADLYRWLAENVEHPGMREVFLEFAKQEDAHKEKLLKVQRGETTNFGDVTVETLGISEELIDIQPSRQMTYAEALHYAILNEQAAFDLYMGLAGLASDGPIAEVFLALAMEEARHMRRFELEYKSVV